MRELAYVQKIKSLTPIPGADKIEKAEVLGWELVVKKGDFKVGDKCVYFEIDSILPQIPCFEFLRQRKFRIKTVKLRGQISQGLAIPISMLKDIKPNMPDIYIRGLQPGHDLTEELGIVKHDPESALDIEIMQPKRSWISRKYSYLKWRLLGFKPAKSSSFPSDVPKTDEIRVQKMASSLDSREGEMMYITEKVEGCSATYVYKRSGNWFAKLFGKGYTYLVCSRNRIVYNSQKGGETTHHIYRAAESVDLLEELKRLNRNLAIQGECIGPKIQGNVYRLPELSLRVFLMYDLDKKEYLSYNEMVDVANVLGLRTVPLVAKDVPLKNDVKYYVSLSNDKSQINPFILREGIVIRSMDRNFSFKSINPEYLLTQELNQ